MRPRKRYCGQEGVKNLKTVLGLGAIMVIYACLFCFGVLFLKDTEKQKGGIAAAIILAGSFFAGLAFCWLCLSSLGLLD